MAAFSRSGAALAIGWRDRTVSVWRTADLGQEGTQPLFTAAAVHGAALNGIGFVDQDAMLVTSDSGGTIYLWSVSSGESLASPLSGHRGMVNGIAIRRDGTQFASYSSDQTLILWSATVQAWSEQACRTAGRNMSSSEWTTFFGSGAPYDLTCPALPPG